MSKIEKLTLEAARAILEKYKANLAMRGIRYDGSITLPETESESDDDAILFGPQDELSYRRFLKEMKEDNEE